MIKRIIKYAGTACGMSSIIKSGQKDTEASIKGNDNFSKIMRVSKEIILMETQH